MNALPTRAPRSRPLDPGQFPPPPPSFRGRASEISALSALVRGQHPCSIALVGGGGSGKTTLAAALGHALSGFFDANLHWVRIGAWDAHTVAQMLALRLGVPPHGNPLRAIRKALSARHRTFIVLDNHEDDRATAAVLDALRGLPVTWLLTARRCLLSGVTVYPVTPPLVVAQKAPFPRVAALTSLLRWHAVALDIADAILAANLAEIPEIEVFLRKHGLGRVRPLEHEDDIPEVGLVVRFAETKLSPAARRALAVLAHMGGDHMDATSLLQLARVGPRGAHAIDTLLQLRLIQQPFTGRFTLHATVRHAVAKRTRADPDRLFEHTLSLLEQDPSRLSLDQTHLFAAMDWAQARGDLRAILRVNQLFEALFSAP